VIKTYLLVCIILF